MNKISFRLIILSSQLIVFNNSYSSTYNTNQILQSNNINNESNNTDYTTVSHDDSVINPWILVSANHNIVKKNTEQVNIINDNSDSFNYCTNKCSNNILNKIKSYPFCNDTNINNDLNTNKNLILNNKNNKEKLEQSVIKTNPKSSKKHSNNDYNQICKKTTLKSNSQKSVDDNAITKDINSKLLQVNNYTNTCNNNIKQTKINNNNPNDSSNIEMMDILNNPSKYNAIDIFINDASKYNVVNRFNKTLHLSDGKEIEYKPLTYNITKMIHDLGLVFEVDDLAANATYNLVTNNSAANANYNLVTDDSAAEEKTNDTITKIIDSNSNSIVLN